MAGFHPKARDLPYPGWLMQPGWRAEIQTWCRGGTGRQGITPVEAGGLGMEDRH